MAIFYVDKFINNINIKTYHQLRPYRSAGPGSLSDRVFFNMRITAFIDGLNLYHSLPKKYKWLDLKKLCQTFIKKTEKLNNIYYFTALAQWNERKVKKHKEYIKALETSGK